MNAIDSNSKADPDFFRCPVPEEQSKALIRVGRRRATATVQETSIDGFTVLVRPKDASKLSVGKTWVLEHDGARIEVHPQWFFNSPDGNVQMGLRRLRDITPQEPIRHSLLARYGGRRYEDPSYAAVAFGGFVLALFALMALPGLGDRLGTAQRIKKTLQYIYKNVDEAVSSTL